MRKSLSQIATLGTHEQETNMDAALYAYAVHTTSWKNLQIECVAMCFSLSFSSLATSLKIQLPCGLWNGDMGIPLTALWLKYSSGKANDERQGKGLHQKLWFCCTFRHHVNANSYLCCAMNGSTILDEQFYHLQSVFLTSNVERGETILQSDK